MATNKFTAVFYQHFIPLLKGLSSMLPLRKIFASGHSSALDHVTKCWRPDSTQSCS